MEFSALRKILSIAVLLCLFFSSPLLSQEPEKSQESQYLETIKKYREILKTTYDPQTVARAHYEVGLALENLGRETEATAEYLKIIINYPEIIDINKKAEERLASLYSGFSERAKVVGEYRVAEGQKEPTIFFAYIKSLYENYRNLAQYDRALQVLQKLYEIDPKNQSYLIDMGNIYLHGYNDADKAILYFKRLLEIAPSHPSAYVDLGLAYEKKADFENAIKAYQKAMEVSPVSQWAMYGLRRIEGIGLTRDKRLVKDWYFLGPFDNSDRAGLKKRFPPEEKIDLEATYTGKDGSVIGWFRPFSYDASGYADLNILIRPNDYAIGYALTHVYSLAERRVQLRFGSDDGIKVWLNDKRVFSYDGERSAEADDDLIAVNLKRGWNKILVKVSDTWGSWGFYFRVTDLNGNPLENLIFDPIKDDARLKYVYAKLKREKRFKFTKIALIYTIPISVFLFGLYFMVSNIYNRIKINRMKEDFISSVSHELKTPIAAIRMLVETLKRGKVKQASRIVQYYDMIMQEADRLTRFINKILDFSRIEKGGKIFYFEKTNIVDLTKAAIEIYKDEAQDEKLKIEFNAEENELFADVDKDAILQVILNLIDNAYKYSKEEKAITLNVGQSKENVSIEVIDRGIGIPKKNIDRIFDKFYRIDKDIIRGIKGSGFGLSFVKSVVNAHNGNITVKSEVDKGSKFTIFLPVEKA